MTTSRTGFTRILLRAVPLIALGTYMGLVQGWFAERYEEHERHSVKALTCGKDKVQLAKSDQAQESLEGWVQVTSGGNVLLSESKDKPEKVVLLPCGQQLQNWVYSMSDFSIYNGSPGELVRMKVWGRCVPHETPWCLTFLVEEAVVLD